MPSVDRLWYSDRAKLKPEAERVARAVETYLSSERKGVNPPEPEVESAVREISPDAAPELLALRKGIAMRHIAAMNCHRFARAHDELAWIEDHTTTTVNVHGEHPVNDWIRGQPDAVVLALIRESPLWLRNAAVSDRISQHRLTLTGNGNRRDVKHGMFYSRLPFEPRLHLLRAS